METHNKAALDRKNRIFRKLFNKNHKYRVLDLHGAVERWLIKGYGSMGGRWTELDLEMCLLFLGVDIPDRTGIRENFLGFSGLFDKDLFV